MYVCTYSMYFFEFDCVTCVIRFVPLPISPSPLSLFLLSSFCHLVFHSFPSSFLPHSLPSLSLHSCLPIPLSSSLSSLSVYTNVRTCVICCIREVYWVNIIPPVSYQGDRHHFLKHLCSLYCKKIESEHKGPWVLDDSRKADLQSIVEQLMKKITLYDPASTLSLGL